MLPLAGLADGGWVQQPVDGCLPRGSSMNTTAPHGAIGSRARRMGCSTSTGSTRRAAKCVACLVICSAHAGSVMITLGVILLIVGFLIKIPILWTIGIIGLVLLAMGSVGRAVGGRRHYY